MARLNPAGVSPTPKVTNRAGGGAYQLQIKDRFVSRLMNSFYQEPAYYGDTTNDLLLEAKELCVSGNVDFVAKAAVFARERMYLRTTPVALCGILALYGKSYLRAAMKRVCTRPDQLGELVAFLNNYMKEGNPHSLNQLKLGLADCISQYDGYQLSKYKGESRQVKLRDILRIAHPTPSSAAQADLWKSLLDGTLAPPVTWEVEISKHGNKAEVWDRLIAENKLPYMAALRNLRNIIQSGANVDPVLKRLADPEMVRRSKQFPYRFLSAYNMLQGIGGTGSALAALSQAMDSSVSNIPSLPGRTFCSADNSGSMDSGLSDKSAMTRKQVAGLFQAILLKSCPDAITSVFGQKFAVQSGNPQGDLMGLAQMYSHCNVGHSTNAHLAIQWLAHKRITVDRIVLFTDMQIWNDRHCYGLDRYAFDQAMKIYWGSFNDKCWLHIFNLAGYGDIPVQPQKYVNLISGFSDKVFRYIPMVEQGSGGMVKDIENLGMEVCGE